MAFLGSLEVMQEVAFERQTARRKLSLVHQLGSGAQVVIHDLSTIGLLIETSAELAPDEPIEVELPEAGSRQATIVWNSGRFFGCQFRKAIPLAAVSAASLRSPYVSRYSEAEVNSHEIAQSASYKKLPFGTRLQLIIALASAPWLLVGLALWISS